MLKATRAGTLVMVRHGETAGRSSVRYYGRTDVPLSAEGRAQMAAAGRFLDGLQFAAAFASPLSRAIEGARIITGGRRPVVELSEFVEVDFGNFEGLTREEIGERFPEEFERWQAASLDDGYRYPGGESRAAFNSRVRRGMERMFALWRGGGQAFAGAALLVAHRGVIRTVIKSLVVAEPQIELGSIHALQFDFGCWRTLAVDITDHLG